jgi:pimeloyl-ACP methyl ester carboxylesterase
MTYLSVAGANLYYEVCGSGPVLLMIAGGTDDARDFRGVVPLLEDAYTVMVYDCRGISRSRFDGPRRDVPIETQADDAYRLLRVAGDEPAYVFGSSSGGQIALALADRHPALVRTVVAHEPPTVGLLPAGDPRRTTVRAVRDLYRRQGVAAAMQAFVAATGLRVVSESARHAPESPEAAVHAQERLVRMEQNIEFFLDCVVLPAATYVPDVAALRSASPPIVIAVGRTSKGQLAHDAGLALAEHLQTTAVTFPGGHAGFVTHPTAFGRKLREVLQSELRGRHRPEAPPRRAHTGRRIAM